MAGDDSICYPMITCGINSVANGSRIAGDSPVDYPGIRFEDVP